MYDITKPFIFYMSDGTVMAAAATCYPARACASKGLCDRSCPFIYIYIYISVCHHEKQEFSNYRQLLAL